MSAQHRQSTLLPVIAVLMLVFAGQAGIAAPAVDAAKKPRSFLKTADAGPEPMDLPAVLFGEVMFEHYSDRNFNAITKLLTARQQRILTEQDDYSEVLLGNLYTTFGIADKAEKIFADVLQRDILTKTRNETWFHTAELQYKQGKYDDAARILENKIAGLTPAVEKERQIMLGNIYISRGDFQKAADMLVGVKADDIVGAYALYNAGIAFVRAGDIERGLPLLKHVRDLPPGDEETNALKDRAALTIGFVWLQKANYDLARESLLTIRMDGPFTNQALLGLGYANFQRADYQKALPLWVELLQRNTSDTTVQEALMLAPRAYEELGALPQALFGYRYAADTLRDELKKVERTIMRIRAGDWLASLSPETGQYAVVADPLAPVTNYTPANIPEAPYLYSLFASTTFGQEYKVYLELKSIEKVIDHWQAQLPIYQNLLDQHRRYLADQRTRVDEITTRRSRDIQALRAKIPPLQNRLEHAIRTNDLEQTATVGQLAQLERARLIESGLPRAAASAQTAAATERLRRIKGLILWDIATVAAAQQQQALKDMDALRADLAAAELHIAALQRQRQDLVQRSNLEMDRLIAGSAQKLLAMKNEIADSVSHQTVALQNLALVVLQDNRRNIGTQLAETHLSIARLQDTSVSDAIEKRKRQ